MAEEQKTSDLSTAQKPQSAAGLRVKMGVASTANQSEDRARAEWNADRAYLRSVDPDYAMPAWSRAPAWRRRPYLLDPDRCRADREAAQRGETIEVADG